VSSLALTLFYAQKKSMSFKFDKIAAANEEYRASLGEQEEAYEVVDEAALNDVV